MFEQPNYPHSTFLLGHTKWEALDCSFVPIRAYQQRIHLAQAGIEPQTAGKQGREVNHWTTKYAERPQIMTCEHVSRSYLNEVD